MSVVVVSGASGLIGSEAALFYGKAGHKVVGVDNDMRRYFFGQEASTSWNRERVQEALGAGYEHQEVDIRSVEGIESISTRLRSPRTTGPRKSR
jgi:CDP-paratose 2-epimerase